MSEPINLDPIDPTEIAPGVVAVPLAPTVWDDLPAGWGLLAVGRDGKLRQRVAAPRLDRQPMTPSFTASLLRACVRTAERTTPTTETRESAGESES